jgi:uncharacterized membrane protein (DUF4010 family)
VPAPTGPVIPDWALDGGVALAVGLLLGLQRERHYARANVKGSAGARTFPIVALLGAMAGFCTPPPSPPWVAAAGFVALGILVTAAYRRSASGGAVGLTTEAMLLLTYAFGVAATLGRRDAVAVAGVAALVLASAKRGLHGFAGRLTDEDEAATIKFAAVAFLLLPFLPDRDIGPYGAINPFNVGLMVVLVAGISFAGYVAVKFVGPGKGLLVTGLLGGLVSTTATTAALARRSRESPELSPALAAATVASCAVLFPRLAVLAFVADAAFAQALVPVLWPAAAVAFLGAAVAFLLGRRDGTAAIPLKNPFELLPAFVFAVIYAIVVLVAAIGAAKFGSTGVLAAGAIGGSVDVDAVSLTAARLFSTGADAGVAPRAVALAVASNSLVKTAIAFVVGTRAYGIRVAIPLLATAAAAAATLAF